MKGKQIFSLLWVYLLILGLFAAVSHLGSMATSAIAERIPVHRDHTVVIDPGHGGEDGGAISVSGVPESSLNLEISLRLRDVMHLLGYKTLMIRTTDRSVYTQSGSLAAKKVSDLRQRVKTVNETDGAVLVSIHQNTFSDGRYSGAQVFYGPEGESQLLAEQLQQAFTEHLNPGSNRKSKRAEGVYLMQHIDCTGVLVECGFLSNLREEANLRTPEYQQKISAVVAVTLAGFLTK